MPASAFAGKTFNAGYQNTRWRPWPHVTRSSCASCHTWPDRDDDLAEQRPAVLPHLVGEDARELGWRPKRTVEDAIVDLCAPSKRASSELDERHALLQRQDDPGGDAAVRAEEAGALVLEPTEDRRAASPAPPTGRRASQTGSLTRTPMGELPAQDQDVAELREAIGPRPRARSVIMCHGAFDIVHPGHLRTSCTPRARPIS